MIYSIPNLPLLDEANIETKLILKRIIKAHKALAELNGVAESIPNEVIILNTLSLQEAKDSSAIENIITTHDELYSSDTIAKQFSSQSAKEVYNYASALKRGFYAVKETGLLTINNILEIQSIVEENKAGFRRLPGTELKNEQTGKTVYIPPQHIDQINPLMSNLETFINDSQISELDPLIKMAIIHHQFESIHPFYDGNGRTGRILNILYLVKEDLLNLPILYLSRYINTNKNDYYRLLQETRQSNSWNAWIVYMLDAIESTAIETTIMIRDIKRMMMQHKHKIRTELQKVYSQDLINNLFKHPYTKIEFVVEDLKVTRQTASKYLEKLISIGILSLHKIGKENFYINVDLYNYLYEVPDRLKLRNTLSNNVLKKSKNVNT